MLKQGDSWAFSDAVGFPARKLNWYARHHIEDRMNRIERMEERVALRF